MTLQDERDKLFREQNKLIINVRSTDWQFHYRPLTCIVIGCNEREVTPGFCAEHASLANAECDRLDNLRKERNMPISLFGWKTHRWLLSAFAVLIAPLVVIFYISGVAFMAFASVGVVAGIIFALLVRKWRELN